MSDTPRPGWWQASDGRWYAPEQHPDYVAPGSPPPEPPPASPFGPPPAGTRYAGPRYGGPPYGGTPPAGPPYGGTPPAGPPYGGPRYGGPPPAGPPYGGSPYAAPGPYGPGAPGGSRTSGLAIASFICSLGGFVLAGIPAIVGVILGFSARAQIRRSNGTVGGAGLALAGIIVGFVETALFVTLIVIAIVALVDVAATDQRQVQISGAPGYTTFTGSSGEPLAEGRPWGVTCQPIVFQAGNDVPDSIYTPLVQVVQMARASGMDVTVATRQDRWYPTALYPAGLTDRSVQFVSVLTDSQTPPLLSFGEPEHIEFDWNTVTNADGTHDVLTYLQADMYLQSLTNPFDVRRAIRQLIAFSQGVAGSDATGSGIADQSTVDGFSAGDYAAMRLMSGCRHPPP
jgi:Domain of unknown function (DUF4190)